MVTVIQDDMFTPDAIADPYTYYGRLREDDPVHWNEQYELWVITRHDDLVWLTRHEVLVNASLLLLAGHETTINLICNGTLTFIHHPAPWALLKQEPAGMARRATEELAYQPSITFRSLKSLPVAWN